MSIRLIHVLSLIAMFALSAVSQDDKQTRGGVKPGTDTLMLNYGNDPDTLNPVIANDTTSGAFMRWVVDSLADRKFDNPDEFEPVLAEKWEFDEKTLEYTIHLRKGVMWHPSKFPGGEAIAEKEFTSADVKFTFDCILNKHANCGAIRSYYEDPEAKDESEKIKISVEAPDAYTVKVKWKKPYFQSKEFTLGIGIIPKHIYSVDEKGEPLALDVTSKEFADGFNNHWANDKLVGTGPMMFVEWKKNESLVLSRNPKYFGAPFYFSTVKFKCVPNPNTSLQLLLNGELDSSGISEKRLYLETKENKAVKDGKVELVEYAYPAYRYMGYNLNREIFQDKKVRWALGHAVPVQQIIDKVWLGLASRLTGPFLPGSSSYDASLAQLDFNLEKAAKMLEEAGWKDTNGNGTRDKVINGKLTEFKFDLIIYADAPAYKTLAEILKENFRQIGVDLVISPVKWNLMLEKLRKKEFDVCILGWALGWQQDPFQIFHSSQADVPDSSNHVSYKSKELDKVIEELRVTFDEAKQKELYFKIHKIIYEDQPYTFLFVDKATGGHHARIKNWKAYKIAPCTDCREWYAPPGDARK